jgi:hypothetical protein
VALVEMPVVVAAAAGATLVMELNLVKFQVVVVVVVELFTPDTFFLIVFQFRMFGYMTQVVPAVMGE